MTLVWIVPKTLSTGIKAFGAQISKLLRKFSDSVPDDVTYRQWLWERLMLELKVR